jgi:hypothetical protein
MWDDFGIDLIKMLLTIRVAKNIKSKNNSNTQDQG